MNVKHSRGKRAAVCAAIAVLALCAGPGSVSANWVIHGRGFGHGIGMSQYGAYGLAKHGKSYQQILKHYYAKTKIGKTHAAKIKVLLTTGGSVSFTGAKKACGRNLSGAKSYTFALSGASVSLTRNGHKLAGCGGTGSAAGGGSLNISGQGTYRGKLLADNVGGTLYVVNQVGLEGYVEGVVPNEMPASWAKQALRAQAVAARSYGLATKQGSGPFDVYDDTRSQVYGGKGTEVATSNAATHATAGQVVEHKGKVEVAYFFSTSGGHTEDIEDSFVGSAPVPYLKGVPDPYDGISPAHKWTVKLSNAVIASRLSGLYSGNLKKIHVLRRGTSPRIVYAKVVGSSGSTKVTGATLRSRLGLMDSWLNFGKHETGVPATHSGGGHHHGGGSGGTGPGSGGIGAGKAQALLETGPAVQP